MADLMLNPCGQSGDRHVLHAVIVNIPTSDGRI